MVRDSSARDRTVVIDSPYARPAAGFQGRASSGSTSIDPIAGAGSRSGGLSSSSGSTRTGLSPGNANPTSNAGSRSTGSTGFAGRTSNEGRGPATAPISRNARYGVGSYGVGSSESLGASSGGMNRIDGSRVDTGFAETGPAAGSGTYPVGGGDHRKSFYGFNDHHNHHHGWSFHASFQFGFGCFSPWAYCYSPFFTYYYWYPYYRYGRAYYYYDYPYYASPVNRYYYDEYYPVYNNNYYYGDQGSTATYSEGEAPAETGAPTAQTLVDFYLRLGDVHFKRGEYTEAVEAFKKAVQEDPGAAVPKFALGEALFATGDFHYAAYNLEKGLEIAPSWVEQTIDRRELYGNPADFETHMAVVRQYLEEHPYDAAAYFCLAYNAYFSSAFDEADAAFRKLLEIEPGDRSAMLFLDQVPARKARMAAETVVPGAPEKAETENGAQKK